MKTTHIFNDHYVVGYSTMSTLRVAFMDSQRPWHAALTVGLLCVWTCSTRLSSGFGCINAGDAQMALLCSPLRQTLCIEARDRTEDL